MEDIIIQLIEQFGYFAIFLLITVENIFPPIPSEIILTFGGFMTTYTSLNAVFVICFATLGALIGALILYYIGSFLNKKRIIKIVNGKLGKVLRLKNEDIEKAYYWFNYKGNITVFFCRFIPIVRSLISVPAGMSKMPLKQFLLYTLLGTFIWNTALVIFGVVMGQNWSKIISFIDSYSFIIFTIILLIIVYIYLRKHFK